MNDSCRSELGERPCRTERTKQNSTMNLTIDMGNTRVKYAVFDGGTVVSDGCSEEFDEAVIDRILAAHPGITQAIVATTRGPVDDTVALVRRRIGRCLRLSPQLPLPIRNGYTTPETLGEDRLAAAVGAASLYPGRNLLIVDFGTAITIDQVSADGVSGAVIFLPAYRCASGPCTIIRRRFPCVNPVRTRRFWGVRPSRRSGRA